MPLMDVTSQMMRMILIPTRPTRSNSPSLRSLVRSSPKTIVPWKWSVMKQKAQQSKKSLEPSDTFMTLTSHTALNIKIWAAIDSSGRASSSLRSLSTFKMISLHICPTKKLAISSIRCILTNVRKTSTTNQTTSTFLLAQSSMTLTTQTPVSNCNQFLTITLR